MTESFAKRIIDRSIVEEMEKSYIDYSMNVIVGRALPDVRDGLKPVHRRILYGMLQLGLTPDKPYKKSARVVGEVLGKYHPHSDAAVYDAMVRLAQEFSIRYPLVDGYGNFGSIDGDSPAAMRYTEARLTELAMQLLADINADTVDFQPNFDDEEKEPVVVPAGLPNLLVNGASGIAVGMSTSIPPHNLGEVCDALVALIQNPELSVRDLMQYVKGPDFPTAGILIGGDELVESYETGRGLLTLRATVLVEEAGFGKTNLIIADVPYQTDKSILIEKIVEAVEKEKVDGVTSIRDESDREGVRVVLELKRGIDPQKVLADLYQQTPLQTSVSVILLALVDGRPEMLSLKDALVHYLDHRREVVTRRSRHDLERALARQHLLEGLIRAVDLLDEVIALIRGSQNRASAHNKLVNRLKFTDEQAAAILDLRLHRLTSLEIHQLRAESAELSKLIRRLRSILDNPAVLWKVIEDELKTLREQFSDSRRTRIAGADEAEQIELQAAVPRESIVILLTSKGQLKQVTPETYRRNVRQGKDGYGFGDQYVTSIVRGDTRDHLLLFDDTGMFYHVLARGIARAYWNVPGEPANIDLAEGAHIIGGYVLPESDDAWNSRHLVFATAGGMVKKSVVAEYATQTTRQGQLALKLTEGDRLVAIKETGGDDELMLFTSQAQSIRFHESDVRAIGRVGMGVKGIDVAEGDSVFDAVVIPAGQGTGWLALVTSNGYAKRVALDEFRPQSRAGKGIIALRPDATTGNFVGAVPVGDSDELVLTGPDAGLVVMSGDLPSVGRAARGVQLEEDLPGQFRALLRLP